MQHSFSLKEKANSFKKDLFKNSLRKKIKLKRQEHLQEMNINRKTEDMQKVYQDQDLIQKIEIWGNQGREEFEDFDRAVKLMQTNSKRDHHQGCIYLR